MQILKDVIAIMEDRQKIYSDFAETMNLTGELASTILQRKITGQEVAMILTLNKLARHRNAPDVRHRDNLIDAIAYLAIQDEL